MADVRKGTGFEVRWFDKGFLRLVNKEVDRNLKKAGTFIVNELKRNVLNVEGHGEPSPPGQPPHKQSGDLVKSIARQRVGNEERVGSNLPYARRLELGFRGADILGRMYNQPPRPYLRPTVIKNQKKIARIILTGFSK